MNYNRLNNLTGWLVFAASLITYLLTAAPTASFWDCGEFIAVSNELQVPHPPGAPLYLMIGRLFAMMAGSDVTMVAFWVNVLSGVSSAFAVLFTFWIITILGRKMLVAKGETPTTAQMVTILGAGVVGALAMAWSDTFWFSAVEAEVYAMSSMFICLAYWLMLKWEARADEPDNLKWLVLVGYVLGLSIGVHLMALVILPGMAMIYFFRRYTFSWGGLIVALLGGLAVLVFIQYGVIQQTWDIAGKFELFFTGTVDPDTGQQTGLGMPMGVGFLLSMVILIGALIFGIWYAQKHNKPLLSTALLAAVMIYLGFTSYTMIYLRSNANPPIDENNPENIISMLSYLKREQYGDRPLLRGPMFFARPTSLEEKSRSYIVKPTEDRYVFDRVRQDYKFDSRDMRFFPRMHSSDAKDVYQGGMSPFLYKNYAKAPANTSDIYSYTATGRDNLAYFLDYQIGHMFMRYFLWNFAGRASDEQWGEYQWESGLNFNYLSQLPDYRREQPTRNHYFYLPLLLGLLGVFFHFQRDRQQASALLMMWVMAGIGIAIFLNMGPQEPRERDYAFVGAYQLFAVWLGLGVVAIADLLQGFLKNKAGMAATGIAFLAGPLLLVSQNWDDKDRSGQYVAPDSAWNLLNSCKPDAILFTNGDNDTFPLWYLQEVEGVRTDVRVVNLSLANTDWYLMQMKMPHNNALPVPISFTDDYILGERNQVARTAKRTVVLPINKEAVLANDVFDDADRDLILDTLRFTITPNERYGGILRKDDAIYNIIENTAKDNWKRPVYFATTIHPSNFLGFQKHFQQEGLAYRVVPKKPTESEHVAVETMFNNMTKVFRYRGLDDPSVHVDETIMGMIRNLRYNFYRLADFMMSEKAALERENLELAATGLSPERRQANSTRIAELIDKTAQLMAFSEKHIPIDVVRMETQTLMMFGRIHHELGNVKEADVYMNAAREHAVSEGKFDLLRLRPRNSSDVLSVLTDHIRSLEFLLSFYTGERRDREAAKQAQEAILSLTAADPQVDAQYRQRTQQFMNRLGPDSSESPEQQPDTAANTQ